jgi:hypothetical protein
MSTGKCVASNRYRALRIRSVVRRQHESGGRVRQRRPFLFHTAQTRSGISMPTLRLALLAALTSLFLIACSDRPSTAAAGGQAGAERIIARSAQPASSTAGKPGITLQVEDQQFFFDIGRTTGYRDSGMGEVNVSLKASRIDGQSAASAEVVLANLRPVEGTQSVGEGSREPVHIQLIGVPGRDGALRSVQGQVQVDSLVMDENQRFKSIDAGFSGRFSAYSEATEAFLDPTHADAVEISGRLNAAMQ